MTKKDKDPAVLWYPSDALNGIDVLESGDEVAVYLVALFMIYDAMGSIPNSESAIGGRAKVNRPKTRRIVDKLLTMPGKLILVEGRLHNPRAQNWIKNRQKVSEFSTIAANASWESRRKNDAKTKTDPMRPQSEGNATAMLTKPSQAKVSSSSITFDEVDAALRKISGVENHPIAANPVIAPIWQLVEAGHDLTKIVLPSISQQLKRINPKKKIKTWAYFVDGILEASQQAASKAAPPPAQDAKPLDWSKWTRRDYENAIFGAKRNGEWFDAFGPVDKIPKDLIDYDLKRIIDKKRKA